MNQWSAMNDFCWVMQSPTSWIFMESQTPETYSRMARISRVAADAWVVFIEAKHVAQVPSWWEAQGLVAVLLGAGVDE